MISQIFEPCEFSALPEKGVEAQKIRALYNAYGAKYDFCRFYRQGNSYISVLDGSFVLCVDSTADLEELADFLQMQGVSDIFCSKGAGNALSDKLGRGFDVVNLMKFSGGSVCAEFDNESSLSDVYKIISDGFDIAFEPWYLDMSHRVRHGISKCCVLDGKAALVIQHDINGEALLSQVATLKSHRGEGLAKKLVTSVAASLAPSAVYVVCEDALIGFYERCGFEAIGKKCIIR
ncbi:MAG: GNAT family N-acetyltransferase [Oscillospiraceae bacterium]|nr:GNAT family N-acetyltransferase [Oscillospiraceae bacterium]